MARRHRRFREKNGGLTPRMIWVLSGCLMGHQIVADKNSKRNYLLVNPSGEFKRLEANCVNSLINNGYLEVSSDQKRCQPTVKGFEIGFNRIRKGGGRVLNLETVMAVH